MKRELQREFHKWEKGLVDMSKHIEERLGEFKSEIITELRAVIASEVKSAVASEVKSAMGSATGELRTEMREMKSDIKRIDTGLRKLTTRFDDFLAQDEVSRLERRTTTERLDHIERRLQRLEARPS